MKLLSIIGCGVLLAGFAGACLADADQGATTVPEILQMQHALRAKLESPTGEYSRFSESDIRKMEAAQDQVFHMLSGVTSIDQLNDAQKTELSNALDQVKATLLANENSRVICKIERKTGTNLTSRRCETVAQRAANAAEARRQMDHNEIGR
jgi:hypothetical protein